MPPVNITTRCQIQSRYIDYTLSDDLYVNLVSDQNHTDRRVLNTRVKHRYKAAGVESYQSPNGSFSTQGKVKCSVTETTVKNP